MKRREEKGRGKGREEKRREEKRRQEKRQDEEERKRRERMKEKRREKMKREMKEKMKRDRVKEEIFLMFQDPKTGQMNWPKMFRKKFLVGRIIPPFFFESSESDRVFNYLHDSNSIFRARRINSEIFFGRKLSLL